MINASSIKTMVSIISLDSNINQSEKFKYYTRIKQAFGQIEVRGVNGAEINAKTYFEFLVKYYSRTGTLITPAEVGCSLSHLESYKSFLNSQHDWLVIFEDDVILRKESLREISNTISKMRDINNSAIIHFGGLDGLPTLIKNLRGTRINNNKLFQIPKSSTEYLARTVCYAINKTAAQNIVNLSIDDFHRADDYYYFTSKLDIKIYFQDLVAHPTELTYSSIQPERTKISNLKKIKEKNLLNRISEEIKKSVKYRLNQARNQKQNSIYEKIFL